MQETLKITCFNSEAYGSIFQLKNLAKVYMESVPMVHHRFHVEMVAKKPCQRFEFIDLMKKCDCVKNMLGYGLVNTYSGWVLKIRVFIFSIWKKGSNRWKGTNLLALGPSHFRLKGPEPATLTLVMLWSSVMRFNRKQ